jgi:hypothetical protein
MFKVSTLATLTFVRVDVLVPTVFNARVIASVVPVASAAVAA